LKEELTFPSAPISLRADPSTLHVLQLIDRIHNTLSLIGRDIGLITMSYPPKDYGEPDDPLLTGQSSTGGATEEMEGKEEEELNAVRRYEDFTTVGMFSL